MSDETSSDEQNNLGTSRRTLLKGAAVGAGALWVAPAVLTLAADPAAASPGGCVICSNSKVTGAGQSLFLGTTATGTGTDYGNGTSAAVAGYTVTGSIVASNGNNSNSVFTTATTSGTPSTAILKRDFSSLCISRLALAAGVPFSFSAGTLTNGSSITGTNGVSKIVLTFYSTAGGTGTALTPTQTLTSGSLTATGNIPQGTLSFSIVMTLGRQGGGSGAFGTADNLSLTLGAC